jgi:uncharacterized membrane protein YkoI
MKIAAAIFAAAGLFGLSAGAALADPPDHRDHHKGEPYRGQPQGQPEHHNQGGYRAPPPSQGGYRAPQGQGGYRGPPTGYGGPTRNVPLDGVVSRLHRQFPSGRLLDAEMQDRGGRAVYHVHWATGDGRRIDYLVDAQTGAIIGEEN